MKRSIVLSQACECKNKIAFIYGHDFHPLSYAMPLIKKVKFISGCFVQHLHYRHHQLIKSGISGMIQYRSCTSDRPRG